MYKFICVMMIAVTLVSCTDKKPALKESEVNAKIDSMVGVRLADLNRKSMADLEDRIAIEVKVKADSILAAREGALPAPAAAPDTTVR